MADQEERELDRLDLDAWTVEPLDDGFENRVLARLDSIDAASPKASPAKTRRWAAFGLAVAAGLLLTFFFRARDNGRESIDATSVIVVHDRARIIPNEGAEIRWTEADGKIFVDHRAGEARYEVERGTPFEVTTPAGGITVSGTVFTVEVMTMHDMRRAKPLIAGTLVVGAFVAGVAVLEGDVQVHNDYGSVAVTANEKVWMTDTSSPGVADAASTSKPLPASAETRPKPAGDRHARARHRDEMRERIRRALEVRDEPAAGTEDPATDPPAATGTLDKTYIREVIAEDLIPLAQECYEEALSRFPRLGGSLVLQFTIMGDASVGGIVDAVEVAEGTDITDPQMVECMSESMASITFNPPKEGGAVVVTYPFVFEPGDDD